MFSVITITVFNNKYSFSNNISYRTRQLQQDFARSALMNRKIILVAKLALLFVKKKKCSQTDSRLEACNRYIYQTPFSVL